MTKNLLMNTKRKLLEFHRWARVAGFPLLYFVDCGTDYRLPLYDLPDLSFSDWRQQAPEEVNEIIRAVNNLEDERCRVILIMTYLTPYADRSSWTKFSNTNIMDKIGLKQSQFHRLKRQALLAFAKSYCNGWLETYTDRQTSVNQ